MLRKILEDIGLNPNEAEVYLASLKLGTQDIPTLSEETKLSTFDVSVIMTSLLDRGFVSKFAREKDFFTPEQPDVLLKILENSKFKLEKNIDTFKKNLPRFQDYMNPAFTKPEIALYEGREGLIAAYEDTLTTKTEILAMASIDDTESLFPNYVPKYYKRRKAANIVIKALFPDTKMSRERQKLDDKELRISRLLPKDMLDISIELNIYDDKVAYFSIHEKLAVVVKSNMIADSMREVFDISWRMAEMYEKNAILRAELKKKK